ncbi:MAG TPA: YbhB/YbcL family Raf kinase inhibitor-like protein [Fervidobacterium sp.]|nr:YbhB/YbcL family Raf kinase inhibitor-like protein [Fervidobacterium sp.]MBP8657931.1 YbhB/YbcL family Raf kinase inhibitor-like protein [Fervidobacterium sp.]MBP9517956.1 YbhB/YbcL family Raf kinase inhibitor-like protein [Fervidobacterium sp.]HCL98551.1 YbhB/YbcL family Raf kinase inhibitor-like protein [Fervidobacterium sp.]
MVALSIVALTILSIFFSAATSSSTTKEASKVDSLNVTSSFKNGEFIPKKYTCEGEDISPELVITDIPANAKTVAIICDDPDAPVGTFVHWVLWNLPVKGTKAVVAENLKKVDKLADGTRQGYNDFGRVGYNGPCPPRGHGAHHYHFKVYALDTTLDIKGNVKKADLEKAMKGHILAQGEIVGLYERK